MKKCTQKSIAVLLSFLLLFGTIFLDCNIIAVKDKVNITANATSVTDRDDGVWLFPLSESRYNNSFSDWAGCSGITNGVCTLCGKSTCYSKWGDSDHYGQLYGHNGIDIAADSGELVKAAAGGKVNVFDNSTRGKGVIIER